MAQAGLRLLPERPVYVVGDLVVALGVYNARKLMRRDGNLPMFAYGVGKSHDLISPSIEGVYHKHAAGGLIDPSRIAVSLITSSSCSRSSISSLVWDAGTTISIVT
jgi:hypothetical protein